MAVRRPARPVPARRAGGARVRSTSSSVTTTASASSTSPTSTTCSRRRSSRAARTSTRSSPRPASSFSAGRRRGRSSSTWPRRRPAAVPGRGRAAARLRRHPDAPQARRVTVLRKIAPVPDDWAAIDDIAWSGDPIGPHLLAMLSDAGWFDAADGSAVGSTGWPTPTGSTARRTSSSSPARRRGPAPPSWSGPTSAATNVAPSPPGPARVVDHPGARPARRRARRRRPRRRRARPYRGQ